MKDLNQCNFIGRLGKDIELKYAASGSAIANFSIACSDDYKDKNGAKVSQTNWVTIVIFGKLAEIAGQYLGKGSRIYISGKFVTRKWQDQGGNDRYSTEIIANEMIMLDSKSDSQPANNREAPARQAPAPAEAPIDDGFDDIPF